MSLVLCSLLLVTSLYAGSTGKIAGTVKDQETGEPLPFANVFVEGTNMGAATDMDGNFVILNLPPGVYSVTASIVGFQKQTITDVRVNVDFTTRIAFELSTGSIEMAAVIVQGERNPLIRQDLTNPTVAITSETIDELPVDQISDVIKLQAGVVAGDDGSLHFRGGYGNEIAYTLNGVSLNDPYGNSRSVGLATNAVQEVSTSIGTFTAEYGNALSGIVNYVTKEGGDKYSFSIRSYAGDYVTDRDDLFQNIDDIDPLNRGRVEATFGGPIPFTGNKVKFFLSGVYENFKGNKYGKRIYLPTDSHVEAQTFKEGDDRKGSSTLPYYFNPFNPNGDGTPSGDGKWVAMNSSESYNLQSNVSWQVTSLVKFKGEALFNKGEYRPMSSYRTYKFNPDGYGKQHTDGVFFGLDMTHTLNDKVFYTIKGSYGKNTSQYYLYKDRNDPRYLPDVYSKSIGFASFVSGGTSNWRDFRETKTYTIKGDVVAQMWSNHEVKAGFEYRQHDLYYEGYTLKVRRADGNAVSALDMLYNPALEIIRSKPDPLTEPSLITEYDKDPVDAAAYIQDKIEIDKTLILNVGLRYEYFDAQAEYNPELSEDLKELQKGNIDLHKKKTSVKQHLSPRIAISYPITDRGIIRLSYGHFYQNGSLKSLYTNPEFWVTNEGSTPTFGNANVNMQKSVQYEVGLQQQLTDNLKIDLTGFYKDVTDYISYQTVYTPSGRRYSVLSNLAYSNVRGVTLSFLKRREADGMLQASLDYTFQVAEGNRTEPSADLFYSEESGKQTEMYLVPLSFDRQHVVNASVQLIQPKNWTLGVIANLQSGTPYWPVLPSTYVPITFEQNSARKPIQWNVDLKFEKYFEFGPFEYSVFVQVKNLFDTENEASVYSSTGRALYSLDEAANPTKFNDLKNRISRGDAGMFDMKEVEGYYSMRPERVSSPREVRLGFSVMFN